MRMLASTAMPSMSTRPARPGSVKVAPVKIMKPTVMIRLANNATQATRPAKR